MATIYTIGVNNKSSSPQTIFFFQQPATYTGVATAVRSTSLGSTTIAAFHPNRQAQVTFTVPKQILAGVQIQTRPSALRPEDIDSIVSVPVELCVTGTEKDTTTMSFDQGLALSDAISAPGVRDGSFRIHTPSWDPGEAGPFNAGLATTIDGQIVLSSYIEAEPNKNLDVTPILKFYVATGNSDTGTVIDFNSFSAIGALCDATNGQETFFVTYNANGSWSVSGGAPLSTSDLIPAHGRSLSE